MNYENRVTVFLDILGFKNIINKTLDKDNNDIEEEIDNIKEAIELIRFYFDDNDFSKSKVVTNFSDCIVISFKPEELSEIYYTISDIQDLFMCLIFSNIICRGAITFGKLIHTENMVFGPALVEAYSLESKAAIYPRVLIESQIIDIAKKNHAFHHSGFTELEYVNEMISKDSDDYLFVDYFSKSISHITEINGFNFSQSDYIEKLKDIIELGLNASLKNKEIHIKYSWMRNKFNKMINKIKQNMDKIENEKVKKYCQKLGTIQ